MEQKPHFLLMTFPAQGHINPSLQFAKQLLRAGAHVTYVTGASGHHVLKKATIPDDMTLATFSDGHHNNFNITDDAHMIDYLATFRERGVHTLEELFEKSATEGKHITCFLHTLILPWVADVARRFNVPSALLWIQPATVFDIYYYYFNGYRDLINDCEKDPAWSLKLPSLPFRLKAHDLPTFLLPSKSNLYTYALPVLQEHIEELEKEEKPMVLVNTFEALEVHALKSIERFNIIPIGPLLPPTFLEIKDPLDNSFSGGHFQQSIDADHMKWLDSQEKHSSVIYISFGSISVLPKTQMEELAKALIQTHRPFMWVIREKESHEVDNVEDIDHQKDELSCVEELKQQGLIVPWCSQVEVLSHPSVGCFVTHCGWNSTLESLASGVPMVAFPQWSDQTTISRLVEDLWEIGVKVKVSEEEDRLVKSEEIKRCLEKVIESKEMRANARKWKDLAIEATKEGGCSDKNLKAFMEEVLDVGCKKP